MPSEMAAARKTRLCVGGICSSLCFVLALVALCAFVGLTVLRQVYLDGMVQEQIDEVAKSLNSFLFPFINIYLFLVYELC